ncbi:S-adenosyl-L-methionine-dependent methyltransferase, partial [Endogone sp. FLAS-F59071]
PIFVPVRIQPKRCIIYYYYCYYCFYLRAFYRLSNPPPPKSFALPTSHSPMGQEHSRARRLKVVSPRLRAFEQTSDCPTTFTTEHTYENKQSNFRWIEGRRYHDVKGVTYFLPEDDREADRLHQLNFLLKEVFGENIMSSAQDCLRTGTRILDVGCGPGTWILDLATEHPQVEFVGIDIANMFPETIRPANVDFVKANVLEGLPFDEEFDLVQMRNMDMAFLETEWPEVIREIYRVLKPGGYIQLMEGGDFVTEDPEAEKFIKNICRVLSAREQDPSVCKKLAELEKQAGFEVIQDEALSIPCGWNGTVGNLMLDDMREMALGAMPVLAMALGMDNQDYINYIDSTMSKFAASEACRIMHVAVGRKPEIQT